MKNKITYPKDLAGLIKAFWPNVKSVHNLVDDGDPLLLEWLKPAHVDTFFKAILDCDEIEDAKSIANNWLVRQEFFYEVEEFLNEVGWLSNKIKQ
jgi:hypothetical protein